MEEKVEVCIVLTKRTYYDAEEYCQLNNISLSDFIDGALKKEVMLAKYGDAPFMKHENMPPEEEVKMVEEIKENKTEVVEIEEFINKEEKKTQETISTKKRKMK